MTLKVETTPTFVTLTLTGPSNSFLGVGASLSGNGMEAGADGFIYNSAAARDYTFNGIGVTPTADAAQDWSILANTVSGSTRTVVARRTLAGGPGDMPVPNAPGTIDLWCARGDETLVLSYHGANNREYITLSMVFDPSLGTSENTAETIHLIYPNPTKDLLYFSKARNIIKVMLYDRSGKVALEPKIKNASADISVLTAGTYFVEVELANGQKLYEKVIKK